MSSRAYHHDDIQALLRGFGTTWPWAMFVFARLGEAAEFNRKFLGTLRRALQGDDYSHPTSVAELDARTHDVNFESAFNVAFTFAGLSKLGIDSDVVHSFADEFVQGMESRADIIGDDMTSSSAYWEDHWRGQCTHVLIGIYARSEAGRDEQVALLERHMQEHGIEELGRDEAHRFVSDQTEIFIDDSDTQPEPGLVLEHFGFNDGISQPPIRGLTPDDSPEVAGAGKLDKDGGWHTLAAGEFLYGYTDEIGEMPRGPTPPAISLNGTYLVYRKLSQDVDAFREYVRHAGERYNVSADLLAAKMIGRHRNGRALIDNAPSGEEINNFLFDEDTQGFGCPLGSHVRRSNPRDSLGFQTLLVDRHRILRRAIPYGKVVPRDTAQADVNDPVSMKNETYPGQGLLFLALNVDISRQFEFVQSQWVNFGNDLRQGSDRDPIVGSHDPESERSRMVIPSKGDNPLMVCARLPRFVETRGGDYFFLPGIAAFKSIVAGEFA